MGPSTHTHNFIGEGLTRLSLCSLLLMMSYKASFVRRAVIFGIALLIALISVSLEMAVHFFEGRHSFLLHSLALATPIVLSALIAWLSCILYGQPYREVLPRVLLYATAVALISHFVIRAF